jgi:hypothetical protein
MALNFLVKELGMNSLAELGVLLWLMLQRNENWVVRLEVFTAVTMKNGVFWDVTPWGSCKNRRFGGT